MGKGTAIFAAVGFLGGIGSLAGGIFGFLGYYYPNASASDRIGATKDYLTGDTKSAAQKLGSPPKTVDSASPPSPLLPSTIQTSETNGITIGVTSAAIRQGQLYVNFYIKNKTTSRFYYTDARADQTQNLIIDGGKSLQSSMANGMPFCNGDVAECITSPSEMILSKFTYIDPNVSAPASMSWPISEFDAPSAKHVSFAVTLIGRLTGNNPDQSSLPQPQIFRFNFTGIPVGP